MTESHIHGPGVGTYVKTFVLLMVLLGVTMGLAQFDLGPWSFIAAVMVATTKATLIVLYFMHLRYSTTLVRVFAAGGCAWLAILFSLTMSDYLTRRAG